MINNNMRLYVIVLALLVDSVDGQFGINACQINNVCGNNADCRSNNVAELRCNCRPGFRCFTMNGICTSTNGGGGIRTNPLNYLAPEAFRCTATCSLISCNSQPGLQPKPGNPNDINCGNFCAIPDCCDPIGQPSNPCASSACDQGPGGDCFNLPGVFPPVTQCRCKPGYVCGGGGCTVCIATCGTSNVCSLPYINKPNNNQIQCLGNNPNSCNPNICCNEYDYCPTAPCEQGPGGLCNGYLGGFDCGCLPNYVCTGGCNAPLYLQHTCSATCDSHLCPPPLIKRSGSVICGGNVVCHLLPLL